MIAWHPVAGWREVATREQAGVLSRYYMLSSLAWWLLMLGQAMSFYWVLGLALQALQGLLARSVAVGDRDGVLVASWLVGYLCQ